PGIALLRLFGKTRRGRAVSAFHGALFGCKALFRCKSVGQVVFWYFGRQLTHDARATRERPYYLMPSNAKHRSFIDVFTPQLSSQCVRITLSFMQFASKWLATVGPKTYQVRASTGASSQTLAKISGRNGSLFQLAPSSMKSQR